MQIAYDIKLMRPGCVLVQAAFHCSPRVAQAFPTSSWLLAPTPDMGVYPITEEQLQILVKKTKDYQYKK